MKIQLEHIPCDLCGCETYTVRYRKPDTWLRINQFEFPIVECTQCQLVYLNPRPTQESMGAYYPKDYHEDRNDDGFKARYKIQQDYLPALSNQVILDIGCARGDFLNFLKEQYPALRTIGVDYFSDKVSYDFVEFHQCVLPEAPIAPHSVDIATAWAVFEHLHTPGDYFKKVSEVLKPGGTFVFLVTNSESLYGRKAYVEDIPRHTYHFSEHSLKQYAEKFGFKYTKCSYEKRLWDPTGRGTYLYKLLFMFGFTWEKWYLKKNIPFQKLIAKIGRKIDNFVFRTHWEADKRASGIIIVEFTKK